MPATSDEATRVARDYYNSTDADNFYFHIWGGEDIHVGLYESDDEPIAEASRRTVERMASHVSHIGVHDHGFNNLSTYGNLRRLMLEGRIPQDDWERRFYELAIKVSGAVQAARGLNLLEIGLEPADAVADHAAIGFDLRFAGATHEAEAAALALQMGP